MPKPKKYEETFYCYQCEETNPCVLNFNDNAFDQTPSSCPFEGDVKPIWTRDSPEVRNK